MPADGEQRHGLPPGQGQLDRCTATPEPQWPHAVTDAAIHRIVRRAHDRAVVVQESIGNGIEAMRRLVVPGEHRFAADIAGRCDQRGAEGLEQQLVQRAVGQEGADFRQRGRDVVGERAARPLGNEDDRPHRAGEHFRLRIAEYGVTPHAFEAVVAGDREHHGKRLVGALLAAPQLCDGFDAARVAHEVVTTDSFYGDDHAGAQRGNGRVDRSAG